MFYFVEVGETTEGMNAAVFSQRGPLKSKIQNNMLSNIDSFLMILMNMFGKGAKV